jgi:hypothetical protein
VEVGDKVMKGWIFCPIITEETNVMVNNEKLIGTAQYLTL